jgi:hypothetical protein
LKALLYNADRHVAPPPPFRPLSKWENFWTTEFINCTYGDGDKLNSPLAGRTSELNENDIEQQESRKRSRKLVLGLSRTDRENIKRRKVSFIAHKQLGCNYILSLKGTTGKGHVALSPPPIENQPNNTSTLYRLFSKHCHSPLQKAPLKVEASPSALSPQMSLSSPPSSFYNYSSVTSPTGPNPHGILHPSY